MCHSDRETTNFTDYRDHLRDHLDRVRATGNPLFVTSDGRTDAVVLSPEAYLELAEKADRMETLDLIRRGLEDVKAGRTSPADEAFARIRRDLGLAVEP